MASDHRRPPVIGPRRLRLTSVSGALLPPTPVRASATGHRSYQIRQPPHGDTASADWAATGARCGPTSSYVVNRAGRALIDRNTLGSRLAAGQAYQNTVTTTDIDAAARWAVCPVASSDESRRSGSVVTAGS